MFRNFCKCVGILEPFTRLNFATVDLHHEAEAVHCHEVRRVELPENPVFAPMMDIKVYDTRTGGLNKPLVGACTIPLDVKIPWNSEGYVAPLSDLFDESEAFKRAEEEQKRREPNPLDLTSAGIRVRHAGCLRWSAARPRVCAGAPLGPRAARLLVARSLRQTAQTRATRAPSATGAD